MDFKAKLAKHRAEKAESGQPEQRVENLGEFFDSANVDDISLLVDEAKKTDRFITLPAERFRRDPEQPRKTFNKQKMRELQSEIEAIGQLQPIVVRPADADGIHQIIAGERRWRAIGQSGKVGNVDAIIVVDELDEILVLRMQIQENTNREGLEALEHATSIMRGVELCKTMKSCTDDKSAAALLGVNPAAVSKSRGILGAPEEIKSLSVDNVMQDVDTLYELSKAYKKDPEATKVFIGDIRDQGVAGNVREAAKRLDAELKIARHRGKAKANKKPKSADKSAVKPAAGALPVVDGIHFGLQQGETTIDLRVGQKRHRFILSEAAEASLAGKFSDALEAES